MRIPAATAFALAMAATPAFAQDSGDAEKKFDGPYAAVIGGIEESGTSSFGNEGAFAGGAIGYDHQAGNLVFGVDGEITASTTERCTGNFCDKSSRDLYAGGRIGYVVGGRTLLYAKGGYTNARIAGALGPDLDGMRVGGGVEQNVGGRAFVRAEYRYSDYSRDGHKQQGTVGVGLRF